MARTLLSPRCKHYVPDGDYVRGFGEADPLPLPDDPALLCHFAKAAQGERNEQVVALVEFYRHAGFLGLHHRDEELRERTDWALEHASQVRGILELLRDDAHAVRMFERLAATGGRLLPGIAERHRKAPRDFVSALQRRPTKDAARAAAAAWAGAHVRDLLGGDGLLIVALYCRALAAMEKGLRVDSCHATARGLRASTTKPLDASGRYARCGSLFFVEDWRRKYCPAWPDERESKCAKRSAAWRSRHEFK